MKFLKQADILQVRHLLGQTRPASLPFTQTLEEKMADQVDELNTLLDDHAKAIETIEGFMATYAERAQHAVDPTRLQAVMDKVRDHNSRLAALLAKFPLVK